MGRIARCGNPHAAHDAWQQTLTILDQLDANQVRAKLAALDTPKL